MQNVLGILRICPDQIFMEMINYGDGVGFDTVQLV